MYLFLAGYLGDDNPPSIRNQLCDHNNNIIQSTYINQQNLMSSILAIIIRI